MRLWNAKMSLFLDLVRVFYAHALICEGQPAVMHKHNHEKGVGITSLPCLKYKGRVHRDGLDLHSGVSMRGVYARMQWWGTRENQNWKTRWIAGSIKKGGLQYPDFPIEYRAQRPAPVRDLKKR